MLTMTRWWVIAALVPLLGTTIACGTPRPIDPCYGLVGINPNARVAILFDQCRGEVHYQNLPPMPLPRAPEVNT